MVNNLSKLLSIYEKLQAIEFKLEIKLEKIRPKDLLYKVDNIVYVTVKLKPYPDLDYSYFVKKAKIVAIHEKYYSVIILDEDDYEGVILKLPPICIFDTEEVAEKYLFTIKAYYSKWEPRALFYQ